MERHKPYCLKMTENIFNNFSSNVSSLSSATPNSGVAYNSGSAITSSASPLPPTTIPSVAVSSSLSYPKVSAPSWPRFIIFFSYLHTSLFTLFLFCCFDHFNAK